MTWTGPENYRSNAVPKTQREKSIDYYVDCFQRRHYSERPSNEEIAGWCSKNISGNVKRPVRRAIEQAIRKAMDKEYA